MGFIRRVKAIRGDTANLSMDTEPATFADVFKSIDIDARVQIDAAELADVATPGKKEGPLVDASGGVNLIDQKWAFDENIFKKDASTVDLVGDLTIKTWLYFVLKYNLLLNTDQNQFKVWLEGDAHGQIEAQALLSVKKTLDGEIALTPSLVLSWSIGAVTGTLNLVSKAR